MKVELSEASAKALEHISELETWTVGTTMQRGQKKQTGPFATRVQKKIQKTKATGKAKTKPKQTQIGQKAPKEDTHDPNRSFVADDFKRTQAGREAMRECFQQIFDLDCRLWPASKAFDSNGDCRLRNTPKVTVSEVFRNAARMLGCDVARLS